MKSLRHEHCIAGLKDVSEQMLSVPLMKSLKDWFEILGVKILNMIKNQDALELFSIDKVVYIMRISCMDITLGFLSVIILLQPEKIDLQECLPDHHSGWLFLKQLFLQWKRCDFKGLAISEKVNLLSIHTSLTDPVIILKYLFHLPRRTRIPLTLYWGLWRDWKEITGDVECDKSMKDQLKFSSSIKEKIAEWDTQN